MGRQPGFLVLEQAASAVEVAVNEVLVAKFDCPDGGQVVRIDDVEVRHVRESGGSMLLKLCQLVDQHLLVFGVVDRDIDQVNEQNFSTDVVLLGQKENIRSKGIEGFKKSFNYYLTTFSNIKFTFIDVWGHGDKLVKHWNFKGTHSVTGKPMDLSGVTLVKMKDGKIIEEQDFDDNLSYNQQLGHFLVK